MFDDLILRWSLGSVDTVKQDDYTERRHREMISLAKLSILGFQVYFPKARFILLYNGENENAFVALFNSIWPRLRFELEFVFQRKANFPNPYHFEPVRSIWWKWIPWRFDLNCAEIAIDADIVCLSDPVDFKDWLDSGIPLICAQDRYKRMSPSCVGNLWNHKILRGKEPLNCGIVGQNVGVDVGERFFEITKMVEYGKDQNTFFIDEQGCINLLFYTLAQEGIEHMALDYARHAWGRDFLHYLERDIDVQTCHFTTWHKQLARRIDPYMYRRMTDLNYTQRDFLFDCVNSPLLKARADEEVV